MLNIFYRQNGKIGVSQSEKDLSKITLENTVWIDLVDPSGAEKRAVEAFLGTEIQSRAQAEEIESSSRFSESDTAIFANTNYLTPTGDEYNSDPVSFTIVGDTLTTLREIPLRSITSLQQKLCAKPATGVTNNSAIKDVKNPFADIIHLYFEGKSTNMFWNLQGFTDFCLPLHGFN